MTDQLPDSESGHFKYGTHPRETGADERSALTGGQTEQADSPHRPISPGPSSESRFDEQLGRLLGQKKGPDAPATRYRFTDGTVEVGLISTVTEPFCGTCNRLRLTAEGAVRNCLFFDAEHPVRDLLRHGGTDTDVAQLLRRAVWGKLPGHGINEPGFLRPVRSMSMIGG